MSPHAYGRTPIKICGVRTSEAMDAAVDAGADAIGFVFVSTSPRYIPPKKAWPLVASLRPMVTSLGLFQNCSLDAFCDIEQMCPTALSQLHGDEAVPLVRDCGPGVIKSVRFDPQTIESKLKKWDAVEEVDAILVDGSAGGQGTAFRWELLAEHMGEITTPIFVAGGLTPENVAEAIRVVRPFAVDVSSGVESGAGVKDPGRIRAFCEAVHGVDNES